VLVFREFQQQLNRTWSFKGSGNLWGACRKYKPIANRGRAGYACTFCEG